MNIDFIEGIETYNMSSMKDKSINEVLQDASFCFIYTLTNFDDPNCIDTEISLGCQIADYCKSSNVQHVVFCSQLHSNNICSLMARHLVAKAEIEKYMRDIGLPLTCLILPVFYQDICETFKPTRWDTSVYYIDIPMGKTPLDLISRDDIGPIVLKVMQHSQEYLSKSLSVCGDKLCVQEIATVLSKWLHPIIFKDKQISPFEFQQKRCTELKGSNDYAAMFQFFQRVDQRYNLLNSKKLNPEVISFNDWVMVNVEKIKDLLK
ncbi:nmrA-like family domain-containing protein 1 [Biomphalaria pfeifferi]|uniref:NmrA-like family domain-containing protein 1 n=1 Tax=Biomphalaria pfeifferi TaxID=112525 RepID=A0AAD8BZ39_BIOPF|nr:nmrA-like family domain-containing protein 1 [Biomphalaria pfeifferi]